MHPLDLTLCHRGAGVAALAQAWDCENPQDAYAAARLGLATAVNFFLDELPGLRRQAEMLADYVADIVDHDECEVLRLSEVQAALHLDPIRAEVVLNMMGLTCTFGDVFTSQRNGGSRVVVDLDEFELPATAPNVVSLRK